MAVEVEGESETEEIGASGFDVGEDGGQISQGKGWFLLSFWVVVNGEKDFKRRNKSELNGWDEPPEVKKQRLTGDEDAAVGVEEVDAFGVSLFAGEEKAHDPGSVVIAVSAFAMGRLQAAIVP